MSGQEVVRSASLTFDQQLLKNAELQPGPPELESTSLFQRLTGQNADAASLIRLLQSESVPVREHAQSVIAKAKRNDPRQAACFIHELKKALGSPEPREVCGILRGLMQTSGVAFVDIETSIAKLIVGPNPGVSHQALRYAALAAPEFCEARRVPLIKLLTTQKDPTDWINALSFSRSAALGEDIFARYAAGEIKSLPTMFGRLLSAELLAKLLQGPHVERAADLARRHGYFSEHFPETLKPKVIGPTVEILSRGIPYIAPSLLQDPDLDAYCERVIAFEKAFNRFEIENMPRERSVSVRFDDHQDLALFLAAVRRTSAADGLEKFEGDDEYRARVFGLYSYCGARSLYDTFITGALAEARELCVPEQLQGIYLLHRAAHHLSSEPSSSRLQRRNFIHAYWRVAAKEGRLVAVKQWPPTEDAHCPELKSLVLKEDPPACVHREIAPGAEHSLRLGTYLHWRGLAEFQEKLEKIEIFFARFAPPIGCELQVVPSAYQDGDSRPIAWKQGIRAFGVPSPERERFSAIVEAAMRPARSAFSLFAGIVGIYQLELVRDTGDAALHISVQHDLTNDTVKAILFPQQLCAERRQRAKELKALFQQNARVMSKGLARKHGSKDIEDLGQGQWPLMRTELRGFYSGLESENGRLRLNLSVADQLFATHLLVSASHEPSLSRVWEDYQQAVRSFARHLPRCFGKFFNQDWFEHTGDAREADAVAHLHIVQAMIATSRWSRRAEQADRLRIKHGAEALIGHFVCAIMDNLCERDTALRTIFQSCPKTPFGLPILLPDEFSQRIDGKWLAL